mgnify:CR=1 FL=1
MCIRDSVELVAEVDDTKAGARRARRQRRVAGIAVGEDGVVAVSYTHLTLPTSDLV